MNSTSCLFAPRNGFFLSRCLLPGIALSVLLSCPALAGQRETPASAVSGVLSSLPQNPAPAWLTQPMTLTAEKQSFAQAIAALSSRLGCAIVADGEPALTEADLDASGSAKEVLDTVADKFDYAWKINKNGVVLFSRRFTSKTDVPQMHLAEMTQMAADFARLLPDIGVELDQHMFPLNALYRTLTPEQLALLNGKKRIEFTQLPPEQQKLVHLAIVNNMFADSQSRWQRLHDLLAVLPHARLARRPCTIYTTVKRDALPPVTASSPARTLHQLRDATGHVLEDRVSVNEPGEQLVCLWQDAQGQEQTLELLRKTLPNSTTPPAVTFSERSDTPEQRAKEAGQTDARAKSAVTPQMQGQAPLPLPALVAPELKAPAVGLNAPTHLRLGSVTLERVASAIEEQTGVHVVVPRWLRERQIVAQMDGLSVQAALDALAQLNGWRVTVYSEKVVGVGRPTVAGVEKIGELPAALNAVMPADFRPFLRVPPTLPQGAQRSSRSYKDAVTGKKIDVDVEFSQATRKLYSAAFEQAQNLWTSLPDQGARSEPLSYMQLSPKQREYLEESIALQGISQVFRLPIVSTHLVYGTMFTYQQDETKSHLTFDGSQFCVATEITEGNAYTREEFGEPIMSREKLPDPFHFGRP